ncbi:MAG: hypothetical protein ACFE8V_06870 [Promethearchaeota archaeon]
MKKKKTITIKNASLQRIRTNFRAILLSKAIIEMENSKKKGDWENYNALNKLSYTSICQCFVCGNGERDMTYNPSLKSWFCVKCFQDSKDFYHKMMQKKSFGENLGDFDEKYYSTFIS